MSTGLSDCIEHVIRLPRSTPPILAMGAWFNNTLCITVDNQAYISKSVGHLDTPKACREHEKIARQLLAALGENPQAIAHDLHPDFYSSRFAAQLAAELDVPLIAVQHHHAHIAALCAEHHLDQPVLGLALDGIGLGTDGTAWGGELLSVHGAESIRIGHLLPLPLPGGDRAAQEPWRMAAAVLHELGRGAEITQRFTGQPAAATVAFMLQRNINCPRTSSMGRVFDAAAGLLGLCQIMEFDAQAAVALEQAATRHIHTKGWPSALAQGWHITADGQLDLLPTLAHLADERDAELGAALFHATLVAALTDWLRQATQQTGITIVVCGGGCFFNKLLSTGLHEQLNKAGHAMLIAQTVQPGDTAIALGQAWVAAQHLQVKTIAMNDVRKRFCTISIERSV
ncbi:MAG: hydrogenase maturation protein [Gallionellaceae bacterium]|nr:MAG: hydrogenase maturation protein [Gallionellaceae bacterium]